MVQEGIPEAIPLEMCYLGWQESPLPNSPISSNPIFRGKVVTLAGRGFFARSYGG